MAVGTTTAILGGITAAGGMAKAISGARMARKSRESLEKYNRQDSVNKFEDLEVSTLGADLRREEMSRNNATMVDALKSGGARTLVGGLGRVQAQNNLVSSEIASDLDLQQKEIDRLKAQDDVRIRQMIERREESDLAGLGQQMNVGRQDMWSGIGDISSAGMFVANNFQGNNTSRPTNSFNTFIPETTPFNSFNSGYAHSYSGKIS